MRPFQTIAQIIIATSVVNCAPISSVAPMPSVIMTKPEPVPSPVIPNSALLGVSTMEWPDSSSGTEEQVDGVDHWDGLGVDEALRLGTLAHGPAEPTDTDTTDKTVRPAITIVPPSEDSRNAAQHVDKIARPSDNTARPVDDTARPVDDTARPVDDTARPVDDTARPVDDTARPATADEQPPAPIDDPSTSTENKIKIDKSKTAKTAAAAVAFVAGVTGIVTGIGRTKNQHVLSSLAMPIFLTFAIPSQ
jgi:hypothetical protein